MSCFTKVTTKLTDLETLKEALAALGYPLLEGATEARGWRGAAESADFVVGTGSEYDIGICRGKQGTFDFVADWEMARLKRQSFLNSVAQKYAELRVLQTAKKSGFVVAGQTTDAQGNIQLLLRRFR